MLPIKREEILAHLEARLADPQVDMERIMKILDFHFQDALGVSVQFEVAGNLRSGISAYSTYLAAVNPWEVDVIGNDKFPTFSWEGIPGSSILNGLTADNHVRRHEFGDVIRKCIAPGEIGRHSALLGNETRHRYPEGRKVDALFIDMMLDLYEAGLAYFWVALPKIIVVPKPILITEPWNGRNRDGRRLHCPDGPAVIWYDGSKQYFIHGVETPEDLVLHPESVTAERIAKETNAEVRRIMMGIFGADRYIKEIGAEKIQQDECGELFQVRYTDDENLVMVKVLNSTPEPDGSRKEYFLRVPPYVRTARQAIAWTFDIRPDLYQPDVQS